MGVLSFRLRGESDHPSFDASADVAQHCRWALARGEKTCTVTELNGDITELVLERVEWVHYSEQGDE